MVASICPGIARISGARGFVKYMSRAEGAASQVLFPRHLKQGAELHKNVLDIQLTVLSPVAQIAHLTKGHNYE
jgi:hypothetical protein